MLPCSREELIRCLCWEDRLLHREYEVRSEANIELKVLCDSVTDPKDPRILEFGCLFKDTIDDEPVFPVLDKVLDALIAYLKVADADVAGRYAREICDAIVAKCLMDHPTKAQIVFMLWVELEAVDAVLDAMEKAIQNQVAKAVLLALDVMFQAISEFGSKIVPPNRLLKMLLELYDHQDQDVLASSKRLTLELCRWIGTDSVKSKLFEKLSDSMGKELDTELASVTVSAKPTRKIRSEQMKEPEWKVATERKIAARSDPSEESAAKIPLLRQDKYKLLGPVDILTPLEKSGFWNKVKSGNSNQREEAVAELTKLASTKRIAPGQYTELCRILEKLVADGIIAVRVEAVRAIGNLALGLRIHFSSYSHNLLPLLLSKLYEKNPIMEEALTHTLRAIYKADCVTLPEILTYVREAVKNEDTYVCSWALNWATYCITSCSKNGLIINVHKDYLRICLECLNNGIAGVRDAVFSVLGAIEKSLGSGLFNRSLEKLDNGRHRELLKRLGVLRGRAPTETGHGILKLRLSHGEIVEPIEMTLKENESRLESLSLDHSITQLKNAAWKEPLEETNQPQKMSLSDSQEQNKSQKQHTGSESDFQEQNKKRRHHPSSEHGLRHFVKAVWGEDYSDNIDEEGDLEALIEEQQWIKSLKCPTCGYNCSCVEEKMQPDLHPQIPSWEPDWD